MYLQGENYMENIQDTGPNPLVVDIEQVTKDNQNYRTTLWTGNHLQITLMSIEPGKDIGLEVHQSVDQFLRIEEGEATVYFGTDQNNLDTQKAEEDFAIVVPAGYWHNVVNTGEETLKIYSIYSPVQHPHGTVHKTKEEAEASEHHS